MNNILSAGLIVILSASFAIMATIPSNVFAFLESPIVYNADTVYISTASTSNNTIASTPTVHSDIDSTPIVAVITISKGPQGNIIFNPQTTTIKTGEEILILNNDTATHTVTNGAGPNDPLSGKLFNMGSIEPRSFVEYVASNLKPGTYSFYSTSDPSVVGKLAVTN